MLIISYSFGFQNKYVEIMKKHDQFYLMNKAEK